MRDLADLAIEKTFQQQFFVRATELGCLSPDQLSDEEHHAIANQLIRENVGVLHHQALVQEGLAVDSTVAPARFIERANAAGLSHADIAAFAQDNYDVDRKDALRKLQEDLARAKRVDEDETFRQNYGSPF